MFKNILSKISVFYFVLWILTSSAIYYYEFIKISSTTSTSKTTSSTEVVSSGSIKDTVDAVWTAELVDEQSLRFKWEWTVKSVLVHEWDKIKKWDIIAILDDKDGQNTVSQAGINLDNAQIALKQLYDAPDQSKIMQAKNSIKSTENSILIAKKEFTNLQNSQANDILQQSKNIDTAKKDLLTLQSNLKTAQTDLALTQKQQDNNLSNTISSKSTTIKQVEDSFSAELTSISKIIEQSDYILWVTDTNKYKNDYYESYLWAKNTAYKTQAETALLKAISDYNNLQIIVSNYDNSWDTTKLISILNSIAGVYKDLINSTDLLYKTLTNSIVSSTFTDSDLEWKKTNIYSYETTSQSKLNSINSTINSLSTLSDTNLISESNNNTLTSKQTSVNSAQLAIDKKIIDIDNLEKNLDETNDSNAIALQNKQDSIDNLEKTLEVNKESYKELIEWPTEENIAKAKNSIAQAEINLQNANEKLDDYKLIAPFDWVVRKIDYMAWDNLATDSDKYVYIENPNLLQITVNLDQVDIAKVSIGTKAAVTFDAYTTSSANAVITAIDTAPVTTSGVTSYKVTLVLDDENFKKTVLSWMTADVELIIAEKNNVIVIPTEAITSENNKSYVNLVKNWRIVKTELVIWTEVSGKTEIVSGLKIGDIISINTYTATSSSGTKTSSASLFNLGWNKSSTSSYRSSSSSMQGPPGGF